MNQFLLVRLYEARGNWEAADRRMEGLLAASGDDKQYLTHYIRSKLRRKEAAAAERWLDKLVQLDPKAGETVELKARMLQDQGKGAEAVSLLLKALDPGSDKPAAMDAMTQAVGVLEELGQTAAVEKLYRESGPWSDRPETRLLYIRFLGRQKRVSEALTCVSGPGKPVRRRPWPAPAWPCCERDRRDRNRLNGWSAGWKRRASQDPETTALLLTLADLRDFQGRYDEAETLYRRMIDKEPDNVLALNNLAWLLAVPGRQGRRGPGSDQSCARPLRPGSMAAGYSGRRSPGGGAARSGP